MTDKATNTDKAKTYYATRDFTDAGTEQSFERGAALDKVDAGAVRNYAAAGFASTEKPSAEKPSAATAA